MSTIKIEGLADLNKLLKELPSKIERNIMRGALREGSKEFLERAKEEVPVKSGRLRKSLRISTRFKKGEVTATMTAGNGQAFYAHMIEFGTASFYTGSGKSVGAPYEIKPNGKALKVGNYYFGSITQPGVKPQPFMRPAFDAGSAEAVKAVAEYIKKRLDKEAAKK